MNDASTPEFEKQREERKPIGPLAGIIIVVLMLLIGGVYFFVQQEKQLEAQQETSASQN